MNILKQEKEELVEKLSDCLRRVEDQLAKIQIQSQEIENLRSQLEERNRETLTPMGELSPTLTVSLIQEYDQKLLEKEDEIKLLRMNAQVLQGITEQQNHTLESLETDVKVASMKRIKQPEAPVSNKELEELRIMLAKEQRLREEMTSNYTDQITKLQARLNMEYADQATKSLVSDYAEDETF